MNFVILVEKTKLNLLNLNEFVMTISKNILAVVTNLFIVGTINISIIFLSYFWHNEHFYASFSSLAYHC